MNRPDLWWIYVIVAFICAIISAFCSAADLVYGVVDQDKLAHDAEKGSKSAKRALKIAQDYELSISSILFGNNIVNVIASSMLALVALAWIFFANRDFGQSLIIEASFTLFLIIFCEFIPKAVAKRFDYKLAKAFSIPVLILKYSPFIIIVWPISKLFVLLGKPFNKKSKEEDMIDEDVLTEMVDTMESEDKLEEGEAELVRSAIDLNDIQAFEIMTPRVDVFAINVEDDIDEILKNEEIYTHSRIPVYEDTIDNIIGILPIKALLKAELKEEKINIRSLCYKPLFVPRNHQVLDLLHEFKQAKIHIAIIVDEYGGTEGIITMEDILEEIVGDIFDESDEIEEEVVQKDKSTWIIDGSMNIDDFFELIGFNGEDFETDYSTVAGLCQEILDRFAKVGDTFTFDKYQFTVLEADQFTVEKVEVKKIIDDEENEE